MREGMEWLGSSAETEVREAGVRAGVGVGEEEGSEQASGEKGIVIYICI